MEDLREKEASRPLLKYMYNATLFKKNSFMLGGIVQEKCFKEMKIEKTICGFISDGKIAIVGYCESTLKSKILKLKKRKYECYLHFDDQHVFCLIQFGMDIGQFHCKSPQSFLK